MIATMRRARPGRWAALESDDPLGRLSNTRAKVWSSEGLVPVASRRLLALLVFYFLIAIPAHATNHETGFLDRSITVRGATYKYQVFVPETWTPHQKWPVILFLHGSGERGDDGMDQTDVGIGTAIRSDRGHFHAIVVMPQCRKNTWWTQPPMD